MQRLHVVEVLRHGEWVLADVITIDHQGLYILCRPIDDMIYLFNRHLVPSRIRKYTPSRVFYDAYKEKCDVRR